MFSLSSRSHIVANNLIRKLNFFKSSRQRRVQEVGFKTQNIINTQQLTYITTDKMIFENGKCLIYRSKKGLWTSFKRFWTYYTSISTIGALIYFNPFKAVFPAAIPILWIVELILIKMMFKRYQWNQTVAHQIYLLQSGSTTQVHFADKTRRKWFGQPLIATYYNTIFADPVQKQKEEVMPNYNAFPQNLEDFEKGSQSWTWCKYYSNGQNYILIPKNAQYMRKDVLEERGTFYRPRWELRTKGSPHPVRRWCHTSTINGGFMYIMGGRLSESAKTREFVYRINCETFLCEPILLPDNPMMRESHSSGLVNDTMYVLFGINKAGEVLKDCLQLKIESNSLVWKKKNQTTQIEGRESHMSLVLDNRYILIFGGINGEEKLISEFYLYDLERQTWKKIEKVQGVIQGKVGGTLINIKNQIYLFGGQINDQNQYSNQIYKIQIRNYRENQAEEVPQIIATKINITGPRPLPRSQFASVAYKDRYLVVLGGQSPNKEGTQPARLLNDIWAFDTEKQVWEQIVPQNANVFKPRSSFTANVYKDNLIIFGGLVAFKDFRSTDELLILNLSTEVEKKTVCNLCKSSFKIILKQQIQVQKAKAVKSYTNFSTGFSTMTAIANTIDDPFAALGTLLHSFDYFQTQKCVISLFPQKLFISMKNTTITDLEWRHILNFYEFIPLIQQRDERVRTALRSEIRQNFVNYLSYNVKNCGLRLGNELLISWINARKELQIFLINKFGVFQTMNVNAQGQCTPSQRSIILQHLKQENINILDLYQNSMTICVTSLKNQSHMRKEIKYLKNEKDIVCNGKMFKKYLENAFARSLSFELAVCGTSQTIFQDQFFKVGQNQKDKWPQQNNFPELFEEIFTYERQGKSLILVYQNNKLMHQKVTDKINDTVFEFHLTKNVQPNLTFTDVLPTDALINAIKTVVNDLNIQISSSLKRKRNLERQKSIDDIEVGQVEDQQQPEPRKAVKTNEADNLDPEMEELHINGINGVNNH